MRGYIQFNGKIVGEYDDLADTVTDDEIRNQVMHDQEIIDTINKFDCEIQHIVVVPLKAGTERLINCVIRKQYHKETKNENQQREG